VEVPFDSAEVTEQSQGEIERAAAFLRRYGNVKARIEGHTDSRGTDAYNPKLSERRADSVRKLLTERYGIDASRLTSVGYGESRPIASNDTEAGRAQNRRVVAVMQAEVEQTK
jgi:OOP family OmpA-OmpF porin